MQALLAIDLGLRAGLALYGDDGRLRSYRSHNFGALARLKKGIPAIVGETPLTHLVVEGGGDLFVPWEREAARRKIQLHQIGAETWRQALLYDREQRSGAQAKHTADELARRVIAWSNARRPTSLRHDAAEAIMIGLWGVIEVGWLAGVPEQVRG